MTEVDLRSCCKNFCVCIRHLSNQHIQEDNDHHEEEGQIQDHAQGPEEKKLVTSNFLISCNFSRHESSIHINWSVCVILCNPLPKTSTTLKICENTARLKQRPQSSVEDFMKEHPFSMEAPLVRVDSSATH